MVNDLVERELKPPSPKETRRGWELGLANRLEIAVDGHSVKSVSQRTGYQPETVRRYLAGGSAIPANFVGQVVIEFEQSAHHLLTGECHIPDDDELRQVTTNQLINELSRRYLLMEDNMVGAALIQRMTHSQESPRG